MSVPADLWSVVAVGRSKVCKTHLDKKEVKSHGQLFGHHRTVFSKAGVSSISFQSFQADFLPKTAYILGSVSVSRALRHVDKRSQGSNYQPQEKRKKTERK